MRLATLVGLVAVLFARTGTASAGDVRVIEPTERIDPAEDGRLFAEPPQAEPARTRSIRKVMTAEEPGAPRLALRVQFALDSAQIPASGLQQLDAIARGLGTLTGSPQILIEGHTDASGSDAYNERLSLRRAQAVRDYLITRGVPADWLQTRGVGRSAPLKADDPGAAENRRVEFRRIA